MAASYTIVYEQGEVFVKYLLLWFERNIKEPVSVHEREGGEECECECVHVCVNVNV